MTNVWTVDSIWLLHIYIQLNSKLSIINHLYKVQITYFVYTVKPDTTKLLGIWQNLLSSETH